MLGRYKLTKAVDDGNDLALRSSFTITSSNPSNFVILSFIEHTSFLSGCEVGNFILKDFLSMLYFYFFG